LSPLPKPAEVAMGAQATKVQSSLAVLRGTPVEVWSKSENRWIQSVIGAPKDVREPPPAESAVLVLFKEVVGGRSDAYKWVAADDIPTMIRARPEAKREAGMMDTMADPTSFATQYDHRSAFEKRGAEPQKQTMNPIAEQEQEQPSGVMSSLMASLTDPSLPAAWGRMAAPSASPSAAPSAAPSAMQSMAPSMASTIDQNASRFGPRQPGHPMKSQQGFPAGSMMQTIDQNSSRLDPRHGTPMGSAMGNQSGHPMGSMMGSMASSIPEDKPHPNFMASMMGNMNQTQGPPPQQYDSNVHMPAMAPAEQGGVMASLFGMTGGSVPASLMGSQNGSMSSMVGYGENSSPNRTPMASLNGKFQAPANGQIPMQSYANGEIRQNSMQSMMSSMVGGFSSYMEPESKAASVPATQRRAVRT